MGLDGDISTIPQIFFSFYSPYRGNDSKEHRDITHAIIITQNVYDPMIS